MPPPPKKPTKHTHLSGRSSGGLWETRVNRERPTRGVGSKVQPPHRCGRKHEVGLEGRCVLGLAFKRKPGHKPLEDKGGGPRGIVDMIFGLRAKCPKANGAILVSA